MKIAVLDDEKQIVSLLVRWLKDQGHTAAGITKPSELMPLVSTDEYDVLLIDLDMPGTTGLRLLEPFRKAAPRTAVILMSAGLNGDVVAHAEAMGVAACIPKPFDFELMSQTLQDVRKSHTNVTPSDSGGR